MNKSSRYALLVALIVPVLCYFIVKYLSETNSFMPPHYYSEGTFDTIKRGKKYTDTIWHRVADFSLTNQQGKRVSMKDMYYINDGDTLNKVIVADFFFTHCPSICPTLTANMKKLQLTINNAQRVGDKHPDFIQFLSFSIDPERDSVERLKYWASRFQVDPQTWWLLTGNKKEIYDLCINEMKLGLVDGEGVDTNFIHTEKFVLLDRKHIVRGYYNGLDQEDLKRLAEDIVKLSLEKDEKERSFFDGKLELIAIVFLVAIILVGLLILLLRKKETNVKSIITKKRY